MSATNHTTNLNLPLFVQTDKPSWLGDVNGAMTSIDAKVGQIDTAIDGKQSKILYGTAEPSGVPATGEGTIYIKIEG